MGYVKKFTDVKISVGGAAGVSGGVSPGGSAALTITPVPCKGARAVLYRFTSTDTNGFAAIGVNGGNQADGVGLNSGGSLGLVALGSATRMDRSGGITLGVVPPASNFGGVAGFFIWDFVQFTATAAAGGHTNLKCDVEVVYANDENDVRTSYGQHNTRPL